MLRPLNEPVRGTQRGASLFLLGLASGALGPLTGIPGILIGKRLPDRGVLGGLGYFLCWLFSTLYTAAFIIGFIAAVLVPLWKG